MAQEFSVEAVLSAVDQSFSKTMNEALQNIYDLDRKTAAASRNIYGESGSIGNSFKNIASAIGVVQIAGKAFDMVKASVDGAIKRIDTLNNSTRSFSNMGFTAKQTSGAMDGLQKSIHGLPTALDDAVSGVQMISASTGNLGKSQKVWSAMNDAILGFGGSTADVNNATIQLSQAFANGKVDGQTWVSMMNSQMGPVLNAMAKQMGITTGELKDGLSKGKISVDQFQDALIKLDTNGGGGLKSLHKIAQDSTNGIGTSMENMKTAVTRGVASVIEALNNFSKDVTGMSIAEIISSIGEKGEAGLKMLANALDNIAPKVKTLYDSLKKLGENDYFKASAVGVGTFATAIGIAKGAVMAWNAVVKIATALQAAWNAIMALNPFVLIVAAIAAVVAALVYFFTQTKTGQKLWQSFTTWLSNAWNTLKETASKVWNTISNVIKGAAQGIQGVWNTVVGFFVGLWNGIVQTAQSIWQGIVDFMSPIIAGIQGAWNTVVQFFVGLWNGIVQTAQTVWNTIVEIMSPIVSAIMNLWNALSEFFSVLWTGIVTVVTTVWNGIVNFFTGIIAGIQSAWNGLVQFFTNLWNTIVIVSTTVWNTIVAVITPVVAMIQTLWSGVVTFFTGIWNTVVTITTTVWNTILTVLTTIWTTIVTVMSTTWNMILTVVTSIWAAITTSISTAWTNITTLIQGAMSIVSTIFSTGWNILVTIVTAIWDTISTIVSGAINAVAEIIRAITSAIQGDWEGAWEHISNAVSTVWDTIKKVVDIGINAVKSIISNIMDGIKNVFQTGWDTIKGIFDNTWNTIKDNLSKIDLFKIGQDIINGLINGIKSMIGKVGDAIGNIADTIVDGTKNLLGIHSPSRVMKKQVGRYIPQGLALGMSESLSDVENMSKALTDAAMIDTTGITSSLDAIHGGTFSSSMTLQDSTLAMQNNALLKTIAGKSTTMVLDDGTLVGKTADKYNDKFGDQIDWEDRWT